MFSFFVFCLQIAVTFICQGQASCDNRWRLYCNDKIDIFRCLCSITSSIQSIQCLCDFTTFSSQSSWKYAEKQNQMIRRNNLKYFCSCSTVKKRFCLQFHSINGRWTRSTKSGSMLSMSTIHDEIFRNW